MMEVIRCCRIVSLLQTVVNKIITLVSRFDKEQCDIKVLTVNFALLVLGRLVNL